MPTYEENKAELHQAMGRYIRDDPVDIPAVLNLVSALCSVEFTYSNKAGANDYASIAIDKLVASLRKEYE